MHRAAICKECGKLIDANSGFLKIDNNAYHYECVQCSKCGAAIKSKERFVGSKIGFLHESCATKICVICGKKIPLGNTFTFQDDKSVHPECLQCDVCGEQLKTAAETVMFGDLRAAHKKCFKCASCGKSLSHGKSSGKTVQQHPFWKHLYYCENCSETAKPCFCCERKFKAAYLSRSSGGFSVCRECNALPTVNADIEVSKAVIKQQRNRLSNKKNKAITAASTVPQKRRHSAGPAPPLSIHDRRSREQRSASIAKTEKLRPLTKVKLANPQEDDHSIQSDHYTMNLKGISENGVPNDVLKVIPVHLVTFETLNKSSGRNRLGPKTSSAVQSSLKNRASKSPGYGSPRSSSLSSRDKLGNGNDSKRISENGGVLKRVDTEIIGSDRQPTLLREISTFEWRTPRHATKPPGEFTPDAGHFYGRTDCCTAQIVTTEYLVRDDGRKFPSNNSTTETLRWVDKVNILRALPVAISEANLAHEMMHVWLFLSGTPSLPADVEEGLCNYASAMYLEAIVGSTEVEISDDHTPKSREKVLSKLRLWKLSVAKDPVYGIGYRKMRERIEKVGLHTVIKEISVENAQN